MRDGTRVLGVHRRLFATWASWLRPEEEAARQCANQIARRTSASVPPELIHQPSLAISGTQQTVASRPGRGPNLAHGSTGQSRSGRWKLPWSLAVAGGGLLTTTLTVHADELAPDRKESAQAAISAHWQDVEMEMQRTNSSLPRNIPELRGSPPYLETTTSSSAIGRGPPQETLAVHIPIRKGADSEFLMQQALHAFQSSGGNRSHMRTMSSDGSKIVKVEIRPTTTFGGPKQASNADSCLVVRVVVPPPEEGGGGEVVIEKVGPLGFSKSELEGVGRLIQAANLTFAHNDGRPIRGTLNSSSSISSELDELSADLERQLFRGFFGGFGQLIEEMQKQMHGVGMEGEGKHDTLRGMRRHLPSFPGLGEGDYPLSPTASEESYEWGSKEADVAVQQLQSMGAKVYPSGKKEKLDWGVLAGYDEVKRSLEDCLLYPLMHPEIFNKLAQGTREEYQSNRPRAVLFEGPPGTGKTTSARVIASQAAVPMIYVPLEAVLSKWFGESEHLIAKVFQAAETLGGAIIFIDELDSLGGSRDREMHEVSRRILSVLLREMEGFDISKKAVVIGATNRKTDLDAALLSRFDLVLSYPLPDESGRALIMQRYAKQLTKYEVEEIARQTSGLSGRDLRDVAEHTERRWASKMIRGEVKEGDLKLPPLSEYLKSAAERSASVISATKAGAPKPSPFMPTRLF